MISVNVFFAWVSRARTLRNARKNPKYQQTLLIAQRIRGADNPVCDLKALSRTDKSSVELSPLTRAQG